MCLEDINNIKETLKVLNRLNIYNAIFWVLSKEQFYQSKQEILYLSLCLYAYLSIFL